MTAHLGASGLRNLEGPRRLRHHLAWLRPEGLRPGSTAVLRVKNEAPSLPFVLPPLLRACDFVLLVDNGSDDGTPTSPADGREGRSRGPVDGHVVPLRVARAGAEHLAVHELSVHSCRTSTTGASPRSPRALPWKWDGDMVLTTEGEVSLGDLGWQVGDVQAVVRVPRHGLYLESESKGYLDLGWRNAEEWGFPIGPRLRPTPGLRVEIRTTPVDARSIALPHGLCVEPKYLDGEEFAHWTDPASFATSWRNRRKRREWEVFHAR